MLQAIEAIIEKNGVVRLKEPIQPKHPIRAIITLLEPLITDTENVSRILNLPTFKNAPMGDPNTMEVTIQTNRNVWDD